MLHTKATSSSFWRKNRYYPPRDTAMRISIVIALLLTAKLAVSVSILKSKVQRLGEDLAQHGFEYFDRHTIRRSRPNLDQFIQLQPGHRSLEGKFTANLGWKFTMPGVPGETWVHNTIRIGHVLDGELWLAHEPKESLEESYARLLRVIELYALPFLNSIDSIEKMVSQYETAVANASDSAPSASSPLLLFGRGGWKECLLGFCYKELGTVEKAKHHLRAVIEQHSNEPYDFVAKRKEACEQALKEMHRA
jgi:hypothetical protein